MNQMKRPTEIFSGVIGSLLFLLTAFGVSFTEDQLAAIIGFVGWIPAIITAVVVWWRNRKLANN